MGGVIGERNTVNGLARVDTGAGAGGTHVPSTCRWVQRSDSNRTTLRNPTQVTQVNPITLLLLWDIN